MMTGLLLVSVALAGCSGDDDKGPSAEEQCAVDDRLWTGTECTDHTEPTIVLDGLESTLSAYISYPFTWTLDNGTRTAQHSMYSTIQAVTDGTVPTNTTDAETSPIGTEIITKTHQNLPSPLEGSFSWDTPDQTVVLWGYMRIDGQHLWQQISEIMVTTPPATGQDTTVTISLDPAAGGIVHDGADVQIGLGDGVIFKNDAPFEYVIDLSDCGEGTITVGGQSSSSSVEFFAPDNCDWTGATQLGTAGAPADPGAIDGSIRIRAE